MSLLLQIISSRVWVASERGNPDTYGNDGHVAHIVTLVHQVSDLVDRKVHHCYWVLLSLVLVLADMKALLLTDEDRGRKSGILGPHQWTSDRRTLGY